jgi:Chalcone isomerase-like
VVINVVNWIYKIAMKSLNVFLISTLLLVGVPQSAFANTLPEVVAKEHAALSVRGEGDLRFLGFKIYNAQLWTQLKPHSTSEVFALQFIYDMTFKGHEIAERSVVEMRKVGYKDEQKLKRWGDEMLQIFPDVKKGDALIGVSIPGKGAKFYSRDKLIATADDVEFAKAFFDIWLSEKTSEPKLRQKLLGPQ